jgi:hypothetical protein
VVCAGVNSGAGSGSVAFNRPYSRFIGGSCFHPTVSFPTLPGLSWTVPGWKGSPRIEEKLQEKLQEKTQAPAFSRR